MDHPDQSAASQTFCPLPEETGMRADLFLAARLGSESSRAKVKLMIEQGEILRERGGPAAPPKPSDTVREGDVFVMTVAVTPPPAPDAPPAPAPHITLDILYEDEELLVINKPAGLTVHPGAGTANDTVVNALLGYLGRDVYGATPERAGVVHRLDRETSGVMLLSKTERACRLLSAAIKAREVTRVYAAVCKGVPVPRVGTVEAPIGRHPMRRKEMSVRDDGRHAVTHYRVRETFAGGTFALAECRLETGRTHQIRVHMRHLGYPLIGDPVYGPRTLPLKHVREETARLMRAFPRQALHAQTLSFTHPISGEELEFTAPFPADLQALLAAMRQG